MSLIGEYDGIYTLAQAARDSTFIDNSGREMLYLQWVDSGNFRKWADAWQPYPFVNGRDIDTKVRPKVVFRKMISALVNMVDHNRLKLKQKSDEALLHLELYTEMMRLESGYRGLGQGRT